jgi:hypothetical protein
MFELIQVTAQYSNAVLVAVLPQISAFVKEAELPMPTPIVLQQVREFRCFPSTDDVGGLVILTNDLRVWYHHGYVNGYRTPHSYYNLQDPRDIPKFYGTCRLNREQALQLARKAIRKYGYSLKDTFADQPPEIDMPIQIGTNLVPFYRFQWRDPVFGSTAVSIELNADAKRIEEIDLESPFFWRAPPRAAVQPVIRNPRPPISTTASNDFLSASLPQVGAFAEKLGLPFHNSPKRRDIQSIEFFNGVAGAWLKFSNGYIFTYEKGAVTQFTSPDSAYGVRVPVGSPPQKRFAAYLGKWNMDEHEAVQLVRNAITKLGYGLSDFNAGREPKIKKNQTVGEYTVPRFRLFWITNNAAGETISLVSAEVNADKKRLEHLRLRGGPLSSGIGNATQMIPNALGDQKNATPDPSLDPQFQKWVDTLLGPNRTNMVRTNTLIVRPNPFE